MRVWMKPFPIFAIVALVTGFAIAQSETPPEVTILGQSGGNTEGSTSNPFDGQGIKLGVTFEDPDPSGYHVTWEAGWSGGFCTRNFQWFGREGLAPSFVHPRVRSGLARVTITVVVQESPHSPVKEDRTFYIAPHPDGCIQAPPTEGDDGEPFQLALGAGPNPVQLSHDISLTGSAKDTNSNSLTFLFYSSTNANPEQKGTLVATRPASGCLEGCDVSATFQAAGFPTVHYFLLEVSDGTHSVRSEKTSVQVSTTPGNPAPPPGPGDPGDSPVICSSCNSSVDAGPRTTQVVGGQELALNGTASGPTAFGTPIPGSFTWEILDDAGLGGGLQIVHPRALKTVLLTPDIPEDVVIRLGLTASFNACGCTDEMEVTVLGQRLPEADLVLTKSAPDQVSWGEDLVYTLTVLNEGPDGAAEVFLTDPVPSRVAYVRSSTSRGSCHKSVNVVTCDLGLMLKGQEATIAITTQPLEPGGVENSASVASSVTDPDTDNNHGFAETEVLAPFVDLSIRKKVRETEPILGEDLNFELFVENLSGTTATEVVVTDELPRSLEFKSASGTQGSCSYESSSSEVTCRLGEIEGGHEAAVIIRTRPLEPGEVVNEASVTSAEEDSNRENNEAEIEFVVSGLEADVSVRLGSNTKKVPVGGEVEYVVTVSNKGPDDATEVYLIAELPLEFTEIAVRTDQGSCNLPNERIECHLGRLEADTETEVVFSAVAPTAGEFMTEVSVEANEDDPDPENNSASTETKAAPSGFTILPHSLGLEKTFVGVAIVDLSDGPNGFELQAFDRNGGETNMVELESTGSRSQRAFLTTDLFQEADSVVARGSNGQVRSFFMMGGLDATRLDGVGGRMADSEMLYFPLARESGEDQTTLFVFNTGPVPDENVTFEWFSSEGQLLESVPMSLRGMGSFRGRLSEIFEGDEFPDGYVRVSGSQPLRGFELSSNRRNFASLTGQTGVETRKLVVPHYVATDSAWTLLHLLNLKSETADANVELFDDVGRKLDSQDVTLPAGRLVHLDLRDLFDMDSIEVPTGYLEIRLSGGQAGIFEKAAHVVAAVSYEGEAFNATLPMLEEGSEETLFLHVAQETDGSVFHGLAILNSGPAEVEGTVEVFDASGLLRDTVEFRLDPGERVVDLLNGHRYFGSAFSQVGGHLRVTASNEVIAFALFGGDKFLAAIEGQSPDDSQ